MGSGARGQPFTGWQARRHAGRDETTEACISLARARTAGACDGAAHVRHLVPWLEPRGGVSAPPSAGPRFFPRSSKLAGDADRRAHLGFGHGFRRRLRKGERAGDRNDPGMILDAGSGLKFHSAFRKELGRDLSGPRVRSALCRERGRIRDSRRAVPNAGALGEPGGLSR